MPPWSRPARRMLALVAVMLLTALAAPAPGLPLRPDTLPRPAPVLAAGDSQLEAEGDGDPAPALTVVPVTGQRARPNLTPRTGGTFVPILLYHYIRFPVPGDREGFGLSVTPPMFHEQMRYLAANGYHVVSLHDAVQAVLGFEKLPARPVVLTFDDGYDDFFTAAVPELRQWGFTATSFVITGRVGWAGYMTWSEIVAADAMGFTIGAHTVHHSMLTALPPAQARWEMQQSRDALVAALGHPVRDFAYPYGAFNNYDITAARDLGFECAVSTISSPWHWRDELYFMDRLRIGGGFAMSDFARWLGGPPYRPGLTPTPSALVPSPTPAPAASPSPAALLSPRP